MGRGWGGERTTIILLRHMGKPGQQAIDRLVKKRLFAIFFLFYHLSSSLLNSIIFFFFPFFPLLDQCERVEKFPIDTGENFRIDRVKLKKKKKMNIIKKEKKS